MHVIGGARRKAATEEVAKGFKRATLHKTKKRARESRSRSMGPSEKSRAIIDFGRQYEGRISKPPWKFGSGKGAPPSKNSKVKKRPHKRL